MDAATEVQTQLHWLCSTANQPIRRRRGKVQCNDEAVTQGALKGSLRLQLLITTLESNKTGFSGLLNVLAEMTDTCLGKSTACAL